MLKITLTSAVLSALICGAYAAEQKEPVKTVKATEMQLDFESALADFNRGDFQKSYEKLEKLYEKRSDDPRINFFLGRCAMELKKYDDAVAAFERVLIVEPTQVRSRLEIARAYFEQKEFIQAENEFDKALEYGLPQNVKEQVLAYKEAIAKSKQKHFFSGSLSVGFGYDSNVNNGIGTKEYTVPSIGVNLAGEKEKTDRYHSQSIGLNHIYDLKNYRDGLYWQDSLSLYAQSYFQNIQSNARYLGLTVGPGLRIDKSEISVVVSLDKLIYGGLDYYYSFGIGPKYSYKITDTIIAEASANLKKKFYYYDNFGRNSIVADAYVGLRQLLPQSGSVISYGYSASKELEMYSDDTMAAGKTDVSNTSKTFSVSIYHPLVTNYDLTGGLSYKKTGYNDTDKNMLDRESDETYSANIGILRSVSKNSAINFGLSYAGNKSNFENKVYTKKGLSLNYIYNF